MSEINSVDAVFDSVPATTTTPESTNNGTSDFVKPNELDQTPKAINLDQMTIDKKSFMVFGDKLTEDIKTSLMGIVPGLNMNGFKLRTRSMNNAEFNQFFDNSVMNKEFYLPWKSFNNAVQSAVSRPGEEELNLACWMTTHMYKNTTVEDWNNYKPVRKTFIANEVQMILGKDLNSKVGFFIIDTPCGSTRFTKDSDFDNMCFDTKRALSISKLLDVKVYNVRNSDSMTELQLLLN